jgi:hypothetical protein
MLPVLAYLDPATGTLIVSAIVGAFAAIAMLFKKFWFQIKSVFTGGKSTAPVTADAPADEAS